MNNKDPAVYLMTNKRDTVLYTGVTSSLRKRVWEHKEGIVSKFTSRYNINKLVYYEFFEIMTQAIKREKQIKGGSRGDKIELIEEMSPDWKDLYNKLN